MYGIYYILYIYGVYCILGFQVMIEPNSFRFRVP